MNNMEGSLMPMSEKGQEVMSGFMKRYGEKKGKSVGFATANKKGPKSSLYKLFHGAK